MRFMFLALTLSGCVSQEKYQAALDENETLQEQVNKLQARLQRQRAAFDAIIADLKPLIDKGVLKVENRGGRVTIGLSSDILFASGSATLSDSGKSTIAEVTRLLSRHASDHSFQVEGHTDSDAINTATFPDNYYLGSARAITVAEYMMSQGFPKAKISAATFADAVPVASNASDSGKLQNRRIELVLLPDLSDVPGAGAAKKHADKKKKKN